MNRLHSEELEDVPLPARVAEWFTAPCVQHGRSWVRAPEPPPMLADMSAGTWIKKAGLAMLTSIQSAGVAPEVNLRNLLWAGEEAGKQGIHPGFETQGRGHQKSKIGVSAAPRKGLVSSKNLYKKKEENCLVR